MLSTVEARGEIRLQGLAVSRGIAIGSVVCLFGANRQFYRIQRPGSEISLEIERVRSAHQRAAAQLEHLISSQSANNVSSSTGILAAQTAILNDPSLSGEIESEILNLEVNTEWAVKVVIDRFIANLRSNADKHLRERYSDVGDVAERILAALGGNRRHPKLKQESILAASELRPSTLVELSGAMPAGIIASHGGWTSHTFILAREMKIPAVAGISNALRYLSTGDTAIVDGYHGEVIINPTQETLIEYKTRAEKPYELNHFGDEVPSETKETLDGRRIYIRANSDLPSVYRKARQLGAEGIGLYRAEFLFNKFNGFPSERQQFDAYRDIAKSAADDGARIRLFDIGIGQIMDHGVEREKNPALGLRAVRLGLVLRQELETQIRAIIRASFYGRLDIVIPMVSGLTEVNAIKEIVQSETQALQRKRIRTGTPGIGIMIEVPSAVFLIKKLIATVDFVCLGTNDLIQYLLAVDRDNESVADWFQTLHPAVINAVGTVLSAAAEVGKPAVVCGEMAGSPYYIPILVGLGATELSMNANAIGNARKLINGIAYEEARLLAAEIAKCDTSEEIERVLNKAIRQKWLHLYPQGFFPPDFPDQHD